jgi:hypothetical protein
MSRASPGLGTLFRIKGDAFGKWVSLLTIIEQYLVLPIYLILPEIRYIHRDDDIFTRHGRHISREK